MWKDLSLKEKSAMMKVAIANGITDLNEIQNSYNKYANGGPIKTQQYEIPNSLIEYKDDDLIVLNNGVSARFNKDKGYYDFGEVYEKDLKNNFKGLKPIQENIDTEASSNPFTFDNTWKSWIKAGDITLKHLDNISRIPTIAYNAISNRLKLLGDGQIYDLNNPIKVTSDTKNVKNILFNDFVENNHNNIRQAKDFINTTDTLIGDKKIPLNKISLYYGIEDGKFKVDSIQNFNPNTTVVPNRYKNKGKIMELLPPDEKTRRDINKDYIKELEYKNNIIANKIVPKYFPELFKNFKSRGFKDEVVGDAVIAHLNGEFSRKTLKSEYLQSYKKLQEALSKTDYFENNKNMYDEYSKRVTPITRAVTENNDTIPLSDYGWKTSQSPKIVFGSPNNGGFMIYGDIDSSISKINNKLKSLNGAYPVLVDNGRYSHIETLNPNYESYTSGDWQRDPNSMFVIGNKYAGGGPVDYTKESWYEPWMGSRAPLYKMHPEFIDRDRERFTKAKEKRKLAQEKYNRELSRRDKNIASMYRGMKNLEDNVNRKIALSKSVGKDIKIAGDNQRQDNLDKWHDIKLGIDSTMTLAEILASTYMLGKGAKTLGWLPNKKFINGIYASDKGQMAASAAGGIADAYQTLTSDSPIINGVEFLGDTAGYIGGTNWFRNTPIFGRYGNKIDKALDITGYGAAAYDIGNFLWDSVKNWAYPKNNP